MYPVQLTEAENKLLGLANIALEREINWHNTSISNY
jgi:hypothetical protein